MTRFFNHSFRRRAWQQVLLDFGLIVLSVVGAYFIQEGATHRMVPLAAVHGLLLSTCLLFVNTASGLYEPARLRAPNPSFGRSTVTFVLDIAVAYGIFMLLPTDSGHRDGTWLAMICVAGVVAHRVYAAHVTSSLHAPPRVLIFGSGEPALEVGEHMRTYDPKAHVVGYFAGPNEDGSVVPLDELITGRSSLRACALELEVDEIVVALNERRGGSMPLRELLDCKIGGIRVMDLSSYFEKRMRQIRIDHVHAGWLIFGQGFAQGPYRTLAKRLFDMLFASALLIVTVPLFLVTALAIRLESKGPVFYRQERVGFDGVRFQIRKFRSMRVDAERDGAPQWAAVKDCRVTRVGAVIRRFRIDELPQLLNVLEGNMSIVGPRPERPFFVDQLTREIPYYSVRHSVKPGLTGWAQVRYQYGATVADSLEKLQYDLYYVKNHTVLLDFQILLETIGVVLSGRGAR